MLLKLLRMARLVNKREFAAVVQAQRDQLAERLEEADKAGAVREVRVLQMKLLRKEAALRRAKEAAGLLALCLLFVPGCSGAKKAMVEVVEVTTVATHKALEHCEAKHADTAGDESQAAQAARRKCLKVPDLDGKMDAVDAAAYEFEQARFWILTGERP